MHRRLARIRRTWGLRRRDENASQVTASILSRPCDPRWHDRCVLSKEKVAPRITKMTMQVVWHGTQQESFDLVNAIARNCTCEFGLMGVRLATCAPHRMLTEDQI